MRPSRASRASRRDARRCSSDPSGVQGLLLGDDDGAGDYEGDARGRPAEDGNTGDHHRGGDQPARRGDRHVIAVPDGCQDGQRPPKGVTPRTECAAARIASF